MTSYNTNFFFQIAGMTPQDHLQQIRNRLPQPPIIHSSQPQQAYTNQMSQVIISRVSLNTRTLYI